jgi:hypothetical protein
MTWREFEASSLLVPGQAMFKVRILARLGNPRDSLRSRAKRPALISTDAERVRVMRIGLCSSYRGMTLGAGIRTNESLRRKQEEGDYYQLNRPLYWNWRPR